MNFCGGRSPRQIFCSIRVLARSQKQVRTVRIELSPTGTLRQPSNPNQILSDEIDTDLLPTGSTSRLRVDKFVIL